MMLFLAFHCKIFKWICDFARPHPTPLPIYSIKFFYQESDFKKKFIFCYFNYD